MQNAWFIREDIAQAMQHAIKTGTAPTPAECVAHAAAAAANEPRIMQTRGDVAVITVEGALTEKPSLWALFFGGGNATYSDIRSALATAEGDPNIKRVELRVNSPGGNVDGLFETLAALQAFNKPITSKATMACSAAYALAAMTNSIEADLAAACFGSIGVAATFLVWDDEVTVTSTEAPNKRPDMRTDEGKAVVRKQLDDLHDLFAQDIASGRKTTVAKVNANFGRGAVVLAAEALELGMIDAVAAKAPVLRAVTRASADNTDAPRVAGTTETRTMKTLAELRVEHPALIAEAVAEGMTAERDRVVAHLTLGEQSGDMVTAVAAITDGTGMTQAITAKYMAAGMRRSAIATRIEETAAPAAAAAGAVAPAVTEGTAAPEAQGDLGDAIVAYRKSKNAS